MKKRVGLSGTLAAISLGLAMTAVATPAFSHGSASAQAAEMDPDVLCKLILDTTTPEAFKALPEAVAAFNDPTHACHDVASKHYAKLTKHVVKSVPPESLVPGDSGPGYHYR